MHYINWFYFLSEKDSNKKRIFTFIYGLSLPTQQDVKTLPIKSKEITKKIDLVCSSSITKEHLPISDILSFDGFLDKESYSTDIVHNKQTIQIHKDIIKGIPYSILQTPLQINSYYTKDFYTYCTRNNMYDEGNISNLLKIMSALEELTNQPFQSYYSRRLGCYEIGSSQSWSENTVSIFDVNYDKHTKEYFLSNLSKDHYSNLTVHIVIYNNDREVMRDTIINIKKVIDKITLLTVLEEPASFEYWIFDSIGNLLDRNKYSYIKQISIGFGIVGENYKVPANMHSKKSPLSKSDHEVTTIAHHNTINIQVENDIDIEIEAHKIEKILRKDLTEGSIEKDGKWFKKEEFNELKNFFNNITSEDSNEMVIIDPFISGQSSIDYLLHLTNTNLSLKLISCWNDKVSPDNGRDKQEIQNSINELNNILDNIQDYKIPLKNTIWYNLETTTFHDRFIYIKNTTTSEEKIFIMSNSLNNLLKRYYSNLTIIPLHGDVKKEALLYVKNLLHRCSDENQIYPRIEL